MEDRVQAVPSDVAFEQGNHPFHFHPPTARARVCVRRFGFSTSCIRVITPLVTQPLAHPQSQIVVNLSHEPPKMLGVGQGGAVHHGRGAGYAHDCPPERTAH